MTAEDGAGAPPAGPEPVPQADPEATPESIAEAGQGHEAGFRLTPCR